MNDAWAVRGDTGSARREPGQQGPQEEHFNTLSLASNTMHTTQKVETIQTSIKR